MSKKHTKKNAPAPATVENAPVATKPGKPASAAVVEITKADGKLRGARQAWYERLLAHNGKPVADYYADCVANPPSVPKSGVAEKPSGWFSWFVRNGYAKAVEAPKG